MIDLSQHPVFQPISDKVIVFRDPAPETMSGLALPDSAKKKRLTGHVIAVGPGSDRQGSPASEMTQLVPGSRVLVEANAGFNFKLHNVEYLSIRLQNIVAQVPEDMVI